MAGYIAAKALILERLEKSGLAIIGAGDEHVKTLAKGPRPKGLEQ